MQSIQLGKLRHSIGLAIHAVASVGVAPAAPASARRRGLHPPHHVAHHDHRVPVQYRSTHRPYQIRSVVVVVAAVAAVAVVVALVPAVAVAYVGLAAPLLAPFRVAFGSKFVDLPSVAVPGTHPPRPPSNV